MILTQVLQVSTEALDETNLGQQVQSLFENHGGASHLLQHCAEITAYNSKNYFPLLWHFYSRYRKVLFDLVNSLEIVSSNSDQSLIDALSYVLKHEYKRKKYLSATIDLSFLSDAWRNLVISRYEDQEVLVRQQLEICIFSYLAAELKTGDACVIGSENYADFREQLLPWSECEPMVAQYCEELGIPDNPEQFIAHLTAKLTEVALKVDPICKKGDQVTLFPDCW